MDRRVTINVTTRRAVRPRDLGMRFGPRLAGLGLGMLDPTRFGLSPLALGTVTLGLAGLQGLVSYSAFTSIARSPKPLITVGLAIAGVASGAGALLSIIGGISAMFGNPAPVIDNRYTSDAIV